MNEEQELIKKITEVLAVESPNGTSALPASLYDVEPYTVESKTLFDYLKPIRQRLWLILLITVIITTVVAINMAGKQDFYAAQARIEVDLENNPAMGVANKGGTIYVGGNTSDPSYFNTQLLILQGSGLLRRVVKTLDLPHNEAFLRPQSERRSTWQNLKRMFGFADRVSEKRKTDGMPLRVSSVAPPSEGDNLEEAEKLAPYVDALRRGLMIEPVRERSATVKETRLIDITYVHADPGMAAIVVNAVADTFRLSNMEKKTETTVNSSEFLQKRIAELQSQIREGEERLVNYAKNNQMLPLDQNQNTVVERLTALNSQLLQAENDRSIAEANYRAALAPGAVQAMVEDSANNKAAAVEQQLFELRRQRAQLLLEYTPEYPGVKKLDQQIEMLEKQKESYQQRTNSTLLTNLETKYKQALGREAYLREAFNKQRSATVTQNEAAINFRIQQQEIETNKSLLDGLLQRAKENEVVQAGTPNNIHVIDYAIRPRSPLGVDRTSAVFIAAVLSLGFGIGLAFFLDYLDNSVRTEKDIEELLHLPALAVIPSFAGTGGRRMLQALLPRRVQGDDETQQMELIGVVDERTPVAEAYRQLRTSVLLSNVGSAPKTILVTSSLPGEGKTTTAINLAISLARTKAEVLIIDGDMRRPRLHTLFGIDNERGLSTILSSEMSASDGYSLVKYQQASGVHLLTAGPMPPNPADHLGSEKMRHLLSTLRSGFAHIVIDSPPTTSFTDSVLLASMVDGVLLIAQGGKSPRKLLRRSAKLLTDMGAKIYGVVLNNVNAKSSDYYHKYYGSYGRYKTQGIFNQEAS